MMHSSLRVVAEVLVIVLWSFWEEEAPAKRDSQQQVPA